MQKIVINERLFRINTITLQKRLNQLAAAATEGPHSYKSFVGNQADYEAFVANKLSGPPPATYEEMLHEWEYLRHRVKQLECQVNDASWRANPDRMGGSFSQSEIDNAKLW